MNEIASRMTGANCNVEGKQTRKIMRYNGGHPAFRERCDALAANGYRGLTFSYRQPKGDHCFRKASSGSWYN